MKKAVSGKKETGSGEGGLRISELVEPEGLNQASRVMRLLSHPERLKILCHLGMEGELSVGAILRRIPLSGSALSQHLAKMRREGLVETRKDRQTVYYRVIREDVLEILETLHGLYCAG